VCLEDPPGYFEKHAWPNFHHFNKLDSPGIQKLRGSKSREELHKDTVGLVFKKLAECAKEQRHGGCLCHEHQ